MGELLKFVLVIYVITLIISMIIAVVKFVIDTWRWHDREERVHINKSAFEDDLKESDESEVEENGIDFDESAEHNTSAVL